MDKLNKILQKNNIPYTTNFKHIYKNIIDDELIYEIWSLQMEILDTELNIINDAFSNTKNNVLYKKKERLLNIIGINKMSQCTRQNIDDISYEQRWKTRIYNKFINVIEKITTKIINDKLDNFNIDKNIYFEELIKQKHVLFNLIGVKNIKMKKEQIKTLAYNKFWNNAYKNFMKKFNVIQNNINIFYNKTNKKFMNLNELNNLLIGLKYEKQNTIQCALNILKNVNINIYDLCENKFDKKCSYEELIQDLKMNKDRRFPLQEAKNKNLKMFLVQLNSKK